MVNNLAERMQTQSHAGHVPASADRRALIIAGWLTGIYFFVELGMAYWSGSLAVLSDAFHTFSAVGGVLIALFAQRLSERKASLALARWGLAPMRTTDCGASNFVRLRIVIGQLWS